MSKPLTLRTSDNSGKLENFKLADTADDLAAYTCSICTNEKNFPKRYRWCITNKIVDSAIEIDRLIYMANKILVEYPEDFRMRQSFQKKALAETYALTSMIQIALKVFSIEASRFKFWTEKVVNLRNQLRQWVRGDKTRYTAWKAHAKHGNTYFLVRNMTKFYNELWR